MLFDKNGYGILADDTKADQVVSNTILSGGTEEAVDRR